METGTTQRRNAQQRSGLDDAFLRNRDHFASGARLGAVALMNHRADDGVQGAGGNLIEGFLADSKQAHGEAAAASVWTGPAVSLANWAATNYGGPYLILGGQAALYIADAAWQEAGAYEVFLYKWVYTTTLLANQTVESKYDTNGNQCSWRLRFDSAAGVFSWTTNAGGAPGADVTLASTVAVSAGTWYFVAGYYSPSNLMEIAVASSIDNALTIDQLAVGVPANVFNTSAPLTIGTSWNNFGALTMLAPWQGRIGVGNLRFNTPAGSIDAHMARLFKESQWFYR